MGNPAESVARWSRVVVSLLWDTGRPGDAGWRWSPLLPVRLLGPGSVPFGVVMVAVQHQLLVTNYGFGVPAWLIAVVTGGAIVLARFRPLLAWLAVMAVLGWVAAGAAATTGDPWPLTVPAIFALLVCQFAVARDCRVWVSLATLAGYLIIGAGVSQTVATEVGVQNLILVGLLAAVVEMAGVWIRLSRHTRRRLVEAEQLTAEERTARRLLEERARIARELHDMVAHHMSVITVQASTAEYRLTDVPDDAIAEFRSISGQARTSLNEMRRLLTVLRGEEEDTALLPAPDLSELETLISSVERAGITVERDVETPEALPQLVSLTAFRTVQEALSNVVRHAPGSTARIRIRSSDEALDVSVINTAPTGGDPGLRGAGLGLAGMRERLGLVGGTLSAEPADGGFAVRAAIPLRDQDEQETT